MSRRGDEHVLNGRAAGFVTRTFAFVADLIIVAGLIALGGWIAVLIDSTLESFGIDLRVDLSALYIVFVPLIAAMYFVMFWSLTGRTIGKWIMGLRVVNPAGVSPTVGKSVIRVFGYVVSALALWLGYLWVIVDDDRKAWHDHMANTSVVYDYSRSSSYFDVPVDET